jgi:hypothetical protein
MSASLTPQLEDFFWGYKKRSTPPSLRWPLHWLENTFNQHFLSSNSLSFKLHSRPSFLREIWAILWVILSIFKQSTSPTISVCSLLLGTCPLDGRGVLREPPRLWWVSKSLYCPLHCGDLIVENWTRSWLSFSVVWDGERLGPLWTPQWRRRQPLWLAELRECWCFVCSSVSAQNCQCSTSSEVFSRYHIYIFPREEGSLSYLRLTQGVIRMSTIRLYRGYINWG